MKKLLLAFIAVILLFTGCASNSEQSPTNAPTPTYSPSPSLYKGFDEDKYKGIETFYADPDSLIDYHIRRNGYQYSSLISREECATDAQYFGTAFSFAEAEYKKFLSLMEGKEVYYLQMHIVDDRLPKVSGGKTPSVTFDVAVADTEITSALYGIFKRATLVRNLDPSPDDAIDATRVTFFATNENGAGIESFSDAGNFRFGNDTSPVSKLQFASAEDEAAFNALRDKLIVMAINKYYTAYLDPANYPFLTD